MTDITEEDVHHYLATCLNTRIECMPLVEIKMPNKHHLEWCRTNNANKFIRVTVSILGYACYIYWKYNDWIDYSKWDNKDQIIRNYDDAVKNWILLKKLELLTN